MAVPVNADEALELLSYEWQGCDPEAVPEVEALDVLRRVLACAHRSKAGTNGGPAHLVRLRDALDGRGAPCT